MISMGDDRGCPGRAEGPLTSAPDKTLSIGGNWTLHHVGNVYRLSTPEGAYCRSCVEWSPGTNLPSLLLANGREMDLEIPYVELRGLSGSLEALGRSEKFALLKGLLEFVERNHGAAIYTVVSAVHARLYRHAARAIGWRAVRIAQGLRWGCPCGGSDWPEDVLLKFERIRP